MDTHITVTKDARATETLGEETGRTLLARHIFFYGPLGSGKTTFVRGLARGLGLTRRIVSPTYTIVRQYRIPDTGSPFYHIDLYRLSGLSDLEAVGLPGIMAEGNAIVAIEWAERLPKPLPDRRLEFRFSIREKAPGHEIAVRRYP